MENESEAQIQARVDEQLKDKNRFEKLSEKVILTSKERDEALAKARAEAEAKSAVEKERDFYKDFSVNVSKYPQASEYQEKILEKVKSGYSTEDAMVAVLAKEGKLSSQTYSTPQQQIQAEGGSAPTIQSGNKSIYDMTAAEKLAALAEADKKGDLVNALRGN
jgi:hypothetical protein